MIVTLPLEPARYKVWWCGRAHRKPWVVIRPDLSIVGYYYSWQQAWNAFRGDLALARLIRRAVGS